MKYLEQSGVTKPLSRIGLGTWQFGSREWGYGDAYSSDEAARIVARALDVGITLFDAVIFDEDSGRVVVILPEPTIGDPVIDYENSGVMNRDRGVLDRLGGIFSDNPTGEEKLIVAATEKMVAAVPASDLLQRAEENTEEMLTTLLTGAGVEDVDVVFERPSVG